jgi:hypothetical protein
MNSNDFTQHQANYIYPISGGTPSIFQTHAQWLEAGSLRYQINVALHNLNLDELKHVLDAIHIYDKLPKEDETFVESGEK